MLMPRMDGSMPKMRSDDDYSIPEERIDEYQAISLEKRLEWLYLGNLLRKAFFELMDKEPIGMKKHVEGNG